jgi:hypothetical protein
MRSFLGVSSSIGGSVLDSGRISDTNRRLVMALNPRKHPMPELQELLDVLEMRPTGETSFEAGSISFGGGPTVFGGQLMAQAIVAGATVDPSKEVRSLHTVFPGRPKCSFHCR